MARAGVMPRWAFALVTVLIGGAALRVAAAMDHGRFLSTDERAYATLSVAVARGAYSGPSMNDPLHWPPGTPLLFALARQLTGDSGGRLDPMALYWAQVVVGVALIVVVFLIARMVAGPWAGVVAAAGVALYPPLAIITGDLVSEPLGALTGALVILALAWAWRAPSPSPWRFTAAGIATGVAILVRADLLVLPFALAVVVGLSLRRAGARPALIGAGAYLLAAMLALAPWSIYATSRRHQLTPITSSSWSGLFVGTYLPADGRIFAMREALGDEARAHNPRFRDIPNRNLRTEWILDAVAARHRGAGRSDALRQETLHNLRAYALGQPLSFAAMQARKLNRMWIGYDRGTHHARRTWIFVVHLLLSAAGLAGLLWGLVRTRNPVLWAILATVVTVTAVNSFFVSEARHNVRLVPLLVAGGAAGAALALVSRRTQAGRSGPPRSPASEPGRDPVARPPGAAAVR
ncbi:MAG: hypothetical protein QOD44_1819 [Solirubrobacteraceae bacterium]|nr:hypothetical protein [Solirubrobacteraceae bacterium]